MPTRSHLLTQERPWDLGKIVRKKENSKENSKENRKRKIVRKKGLRMLRYTKPDADQTLRHIA